MAANAGAEPAEQNEKPPKQRQRQRQLCEKCNIDERRAVTKRVVTQKPLCKDCFINDFEEDVHAVITAQSLFRRGERVAVGASGGKDSTVLAHVLTRLNARYDYGIEILLLSIDEGIAGYRDDSLASVRRNERRYELPLTVVSYSEVYGWTMDDIVRHVGRKNNCTFCGVFRRQALDRGAALLRADKIATGHNADDVAETVLLNLLRGDLPRLTRCTQITTAAAAPDADGASWSVPRCKPLMYAYEKEIVQYAHYNRLDYFSTECVYSPFAYRGFVRDFIKDLERIRPRAILDIIRSAECFCVDAGSNGAARMPQQGVCERCGYIASQKWCKACVLLDGLNRGLPKLGISRTRNRRSSANAKAQDEAPPPTPTPPALPPTDSYHHRRPMWPAAAFSAPLVAAFLRVSIILFPLNSAVTNTLAMAVRNFVTRSIIQTVYNLTRYVEGMILMYSELWRYLLLRLEIDMIFHASYLCILTFDRFNRGHLG